VHPHFLRNQLIDGGEIVSLMHRPSYTVGNDLWYSFILDAVSTLVDRLSGLAVRLPGYRPRGPGYDSRRYQII
jgi:hypothetical protein